MSQGYAPQQQQYVMQQQPSYGYTQQQGGLQYGSAQVQSQAPMQQYAQAVPHPPAQYVQQRPVQYTTQAPVQYTQALPQTTYVPRASSGAVMTTSPVPVQYTQSVQYTQAPQRQVSLVAAPQTVQYIQAPQQQQVTRVVTGQAPQQFIQQGGMGFQSSDPFANLQPGQPLTPQQCAMLNLPPGAIFSGVGGGSESQQPEQQDYASQQYGGGQYQQQQQQQQGYAQQYEQPASYQYDPAQYSQQQYSDPYPQSAAAPQGGDQVSGTQV